MSKVIVKISFKHPNLKNTKGSNVAHLNYIGTRPGVDKSLTESDLQKELSGRVETENEEYVKYINERPRSHGLFDSDGPVNIETVKDEIANNEGFVWRAIVSLREEDALALGYENKEKWQDLLRKQMPEMAYKMGIKLENLRWVSAIHMEKGHPHAHVMIWEKKPEAMVGIISKKTIESIRKQYIDEVFQDEKLHYINEKNAMRDLVRDLANGDMGQIARLIKEVRDTGDEVQLLTRDEIKPGLAPRLYPEIESELLNRVNALASILPGQGRANLKFMPENVKEEVKKFSDYVLNLDQYKPFVSKYLKAVENNNRLYTSDEGKIKESVDRAYNDLRDRVSQVLLRAAVESTVEEKYKVNLEFATAAAEVFKTLDNKIDLFSERKAVLSHVTNVLVATGHDDRFIYGVLSNCSLADDLRLSEDEMRYIINEARVTGVLINDFADTKSLVVFLSSLKLAGYSEDRAFNLLKTAISDNKDFTESKLDGLVTDGYFMKSDGEYRLTDRGIDEFVKVMVLDGSQKEILTEILKGSSSLDDLYEKDRIMNRLVDKDPEEFKIGRFDIRVKEEFGENNRTTFKDIERNIYEKYTANGITEIEKAEREIDSIERRIEKLCLNGYVSYDKATGIYSFTEEGLTELKNVPSKMEFSLYDANVTTSYIDESQDGILNAEDLKVKVYSEIANKAAIEYNECFESVLKNGRYSEFIKVEDGHIHVTEEGKALGRDLNSFNKFFAASKDGSITLDKMNEVCNELYGDESSQQYQKAMQKLFDQVSRGNMVEKTDGSFILDPSKADIKSVLSVLYKAGGSLRLEEVKEYLEKSIPNKEAEKQFNYLIKRLDNAKKLGYVSGRAGQYSLTNAGIKKRLDLQKPQRAILRKEVEFLKRMGLLRVTNEGIKITEKGNRLLETSGRQERGESTIDKKVVSLIDKTLDHINVDKLKRVNLRMAAGMYLNNEYEGLKNDYKNLRSVLKVQDLEVKTISNAVTALHLSGMSEAEIKDVLDSWNRNSGSRIDIDKMSQIYSDTFKKIGDAQLYGKTPFISYKDWNEMFKALGVGDPPRWIYSNNDQRSFGSHGGMLPLAYDVWKAIWNTVEARRLSEEFMAMHNKKAIAKAAAMEDKSARKEQSRKLHSPGLVKEDEVEK